MDLTQVQEELERRKADGQGDGSSTETASYTGPASTTNEKRKPKHAEENMWVYMTVQLYTMERDHYLVDFKSAGYERIATSVVREKRVELSNGAVEWQRVEAGEQLGPDTQVREREVFVGLGRSKEEKSATSPFPFLTMASRLVAELADPHGAGKS